MSALLEVDNLRVTFTSHKETVRAVRGVSFAMGRDKLGIVGESGSGKSVTCRALLGLVRAPGRVRYDGLRFDGEDLHPADRLHAALIRGVQILPVEAQPVVAHATRGAHQTQQGPAGDGFPGA